MEFFDEVLEPNKLANTMKNGKKIFAAMADLQKATTDNARITSKGKRVGNSDMRVVARFPEALLIQLLALEPDLLRDKKTFWKILNKYPAYKAHLSY